MITSKAARWMNTWRTKWKRGRFWHSAARKKQSPSRPFMMRKLP
ncbi:hypothetical protein T03_17601, partial [Trichinella britovi]